MAHWTKLISVLIALCKLPTYTARLVTSLIGPPTDPPNRWVAGFPPPKSGPDETLVHCTKIVTLLIL